MLNKGSRGYLFYIISFLLTLIIKFLVYRIYNLEFGPVILSKFIVFYVILSFNEILIDFGYSFYCYTKGAIKSASWLSMLIGLIVTLVYALINVIFINDISLVFWFFLYSLGFSFYNIEKSQRLSRGDFLATAVWDTFGLSIFLILFVLVGNESAIYAAQCGSIFTLGFIELVRSRPELSWQNIRKDFAVLKSVGSNKIISGIVNSFSRDFDVIFLGLKTLPGGSIYVVARDIYRKPLAILDPLLYRLFVLLNRDKSFGYRKTLSLYIVFYLLLLLACMLLTPLLEEYYLGFEVPFSILSVVLVSVFLRGITSFIGIYFTANYRHRDEVYYNLATLFSSIISFVVLVVIPHRFLMIFLTKSIIDLIIFIIYLWKRKIWIR